MMFFYGYFLDIDIDIDIVGVGNLLVNWLVSCDVGIWDRYRVI